MHTMPYILLAIITITAVGTFLNSSRSRRAEKGAREALQAKMNMHMGVMFLSITALQLFTVNVSTPRVIAATFIGLLGLFNLFAGFRNYRAFRKYLS